MTRSDLVTHLAERFSQLTHRDTEFAVKTILDAMSAALAKGHRIEIRGFGSFELRHYRARQGRNPRTGASVTVKPKRLPYFKVGKELRARVAKGKRAPRVEVKPIMQPEDLRVAPAENPSVKF